MTAEIIRVAILPAFTGQDHIKRVYSTDGISPTITTMGGGNTEPKILIRGGGE